MNEYMTQIVGNVFHRIDNGESIADVILDIRKKLPDSWKTVLFHFQRLRGDFDKFPE